MNRSTVSRKAVASVLLVAAGLGMATVPAAAEDGTGAITGSVWFDRNNDKTQNAGEPGRANAAVELHRDGKLVETYRADAAGKYTITGLAPGDYTVKNAPGFGYFFTTPDEVAVAVDGAKQVNFGMKGARIVGTVWRDNNGDGTRQSVDEAMRMRGSKVQLEGINFPTMRSTVDAQGRFAFEDLPNGDTFRLHAPNRTADGDEFTVSGKGSVIDQNTGQSGVLGLRNNETLEVGVGYRRLSADLALDAMIMPEAAKVGVPFKVTGRITNHGNVTANYLVQVELPKGVRCLALEGLKQTPGGDDHLVNGTSVQPLIAGGGANFSFTLVADKPVAANFWMGSNPVDLLDWNPKNNSREAKLVVTAANPGTTTPPAAQPVVNKKTPAAKTPATNAEVKDLASTGASPMIPVLLGAVLLAAGGALLFVLRRRVSRR